MNILLVRFRMGLFILGTVEGGVGIHMDTPRIFWTISVTLSHFKAYVAAFFSQLNVLVFQETSNSIMIQLDTENTI